ncbi:Pr6Pr family membrane protein [Methylocapsa palsarum]|uniref:FAR-17a/AIG1-like protein n=1 Tax=Methylocapsa palsarum TaxID=1612308 RepID=A0A1I3W9F0_9HYPH|nr:Pr6Pr family membrane protein [Methylocapsa palsarum]SFK03066.1 hypothetical protein SAMN05444581_101381 [Methylocapsa palsarum]
MQNVSVSGVRARQTFIQFQRASAAFIAAAAWFALTVQISYNIEEARTNNASVAASVVHFFSYFTMQTNLLVALILTLSFFQPQSEWFLTRTSVQSAVASYIVIVALVYTLLLRNLWNPQGWRLVADRLLHDEIPLLYVLYWIFFMPKGSLTRVDPVLWLIYPLLYFVYILARGAAIGSYPYPFVDVARLGYREVLYNATMFLGAFFALGVTFTGLDRAMSGYASSAASEAGAPKGSLTGATPTDANRMEANLAERPNSDK